MPLLNGTASNFICPDSALSTYRYRYRIHVVSCSSLGFLADINAWRCAVFAQIEPKLSCCRFARVTSVKCRANGVRRIAGSQWKGFYEIHSSMVFCDVVKYSRKRLTFDYALVTFARHFCRLLKARRPFYQTLPM